MRLIDEWKTRLLSEYTRKVLSVPLSSPLAYMLVFLFLKALLGLQFLPDIRLLAPRWLYPDSLGHL